MLTEKEFLLTLALTKFNEQYNMDLKVSECDIFSIPVRFNAHVSYEIYTSTREDYVRLHIHLLIEGTDGLQDYRLELDPYYLGNGLGNNFDELYVAMGNVEQYYVDQGIYSFLPIVEDSSNSNTLLLEDGNELLLESGEQIVLEIAI
jgi:hypothetical protein